MARPPKNIYFYFLDHQYLLVIVGSCLFKFWDTRTPKQNQEKSWIILKPIIFTNLKIVETHSFDNFGKDGHCNMMQIRLIKSWKSCMGINIFLKTRNGHLVHFWNNETNNKQTQTNQHTFLIFKWGNPQHPSTYRLPPQHPSTHRCRTGSSTCSRFSNFGCNFVEHVGRLFCLSSFGSPIVVGDYDGLCIIKK